MELNDGTSSVNDTGELCVRMSDFIDFPPNLNLQHITSTINPVQLCSMPVE